MRLQVLLVRQRMVYVPTNKNYPKEDANQNQNLFLKHFMSANKNYPKENANQYQDLFLKHFI